jgi:hypothetical protein
LNRVGVVRVSSAKVDDLAGAAWVLGSGIAGFVGAIVSGATTLGLGTAAFVGAVAYGVMQALRRWRDLDDDPPEGYETLPASAIIRSSVVASAWPALTGPIIGVVCVAICLWTEWGVLSAGALCALSTRSLVKWNRIRRWERQHDATVYYERMPLLTGGISQRYILEQS